MRKCFAFLLSVILIIHTTAVFAQDTAVNNEAYITGQKSENIEILLNKLNIVTDTGNFEDTVGKAKFLGYMVNLLQMPIVPATEQIFFDVPLTNEYADIVNTAYATGIVNGNDDGTLAVDTPVTLNEATAIAVRALENICYISESTSDSFEEYGNWAAKLGLLDGVKASDGGALNREAVLRLLYNILNAECISTDNWKDFYWEDITFMEARYDIKEEDGIVEACQYGEIYGGDALTDGRVKIGEEQFSYDNNEAKKLLGHKVTYYYNIKDTDTNTPEILYMFSSGNKIITIDVEDIEYHKQGELEYTDSEGHDYRLNLSETAMTLLNGKRVAVGAGGMTLPLHGNVTLVDNDTNGRYDVLLYNQYSIAVVQSVNADEKKLYSKKGKYPLIELDKYDAYYIKDKEGNGIDLASLAEDTILNISENGYKTVMEITACTDTAEITVKSIRNEVIKNYTVYYLIDENGNEYRTVLDFAGIHDNNSFITDSTSVALSSKFNVAFNCDGKIAAILKRSDASGYMYGYVIESYYDPNFNEKSTVCILSENNEIKSYEVADKVQVINGTNSSSVTEASFMTVTMSAFITGGVLRFKINEKGQLCAVETPQNAGVETGLRKDKEITTGQSESTRFYSANNMLGGQIVLNSETSVFVVPAQENRGDKEWYYSIKGTALENQKYYPSCVSYKYDDDVYADIVVMQVSDYVIQSAPLMLVEQVSSVYDPETDEVYEALSGYVNGNKMTYCVENGNYPVVSQASTFRAAEGDVIRFTINIKGHIGLLEPVFDYSEPRVYNYNMSSTKRYAYGNGICQAYGQMYDIYDGTYMNVRNSDDSEQFNYYYPITAETRFYEYDDSTSKQTVKAITADDVLTVNADQVTTETVLVVTRNTTTPLVVVYK